MNARPNAQPQRLKGVPCPAAAPKMLQLPERFDRLTVRNFASLKNERRRLNQPVLLHISAVFQRPKPRQSDEQWKIYEQT
jgi:hypothetical protein